MMCCGSWLLQWAISEIYSQFSQNPTFTLDINSVIQVGFQESIKKCEGIYGPLKKSLMEAVANILKKVLAISSTINWQYFVIFLWTIFLQHIDQPLAFVTFHAAYSFRFVLYSISTNYLFSYLKPNICRVKTRNSKKNISRALCPNAFIRWRSPVHYEKRWHFEKKKW